MKKLSNHLTSVHSITDTTTRKELLAKAKKAGVAKRGEMKRNLLQLTIQQSFQISQHVDKNIVVPTAQKKKGSTRSYEFYDIDNTKELAAFYKNLTSFDGGSKSSVEARQICTDVSKYLAFADSTQLKWDNLLDTDRLKQYVEKLQKTAIGPDGLVTKLDRVQTALRYLMRDVPKYKTSDAAMKTIERVGLWKAGFRTAKITHTRDKAAREVDTTDDDMQALKELIHSKIAKTKVETIVNRGKSSDEDINFIATYLFICFGYKNFQRAGPAINMTLKEVAEATYVGEDEDTMLKIIVSNHKTAKTYGPAVLYLSLDDSAIFNHYIEEIRPNIATSAECDIALLRANGLSFRNNYSHIIRAYAIEVGLTRIPSLTAVRKAGAVTGRAVLSNPEMEAMSRQMSHSSATSELYYRVRKGGKQSLSAFKSMQMLTGK